MTKVVEIKDFNKNKFIDWCKKVGKNHEDKISMIEYFANVMNDEASKETLKKLLYSGEINIDNIGLVPMTEDKEEKKIINERQLLGMRNIIRGILNLFDADDKLIKKVLGDWDEFDEHKKNAYCMSVVECFGETLSMIVNRHKRY